MNKAFTIRFLFFIFILFNLQTARPNQGLKIGAGIGAVSVSAYVLIKGYIAFKKELPLMVISGRRRLVDLQEQLNGDKRSLHALYSHYLPREKKEVVEDVKMLLQESNEDIALSIDNEIQYLKSARDIIVHNHSSWDIVKRVENCAREAQIQAGIDLSFKFKFEKITHAQYQAMDDAFYQNAYTSWSWLVWNLQEAIHFVWYIQKKIYRLEAIQRIMWEDAHQRPGQDIHLHHH